MAPKAEARGGGDIGRDRELGAGAAGEEGGLDGDCGSEHREGEGDGRGGPGRAGLPFWRERRGGGREDLKIGVGVPSK